MTTAHEIAADDIRAALKARFAAPRNTIVFEVAQTTGFNANRHIDAVAMDTWPSSGFHLSGIEIKTSRGDWKREIKDPMKAEEIAARVDTMWVAAPTDIVSRETLPPKWGLLEIDPKTRQMVTAVNAMSTEAMAIDRKFLAAMMRAAGRSVSGLVDAVIAERERQFEEAWNHKKRDEERRVADLKDPDGASWRKLKDAIGDGFPYFDEEVIEVFRVIARSGTATKFDGPRKLAQRLRDMIPTMTDVAERIEAACDEAHLSKSPLLDDLHQRISKRRRA